MRDALRCGAAWNAQEVQCVNPVIAELTEPWRPDQNSPCNDSKAIQRCSQTSGVVAVFAELFAPGEFCCLLSIYVCLVTGRLPMLPGNGVPVALENDEQSPEEGEHALAEALTARITSLDAQLAKLGVLGK